MGFKQKIIKPKKSVTPAKEGDELMEKQVVAMGDRWLSVACIAAGVVSLLLLVFFFTSDTRDKIIAAKTSPVYAAQSNHVDSAKTEETDIEGLLDDPNVSRDVIIATMLRMSDADFDAFVEKITAKTDTSKTHKADAEQTADVLQSLLQKGSDKSDVIAFLKGLDEEGYQELIGALTIVSESGTADGFFRKELEDAYAEAERLYPGQVDGSKRLKLIDELNATDYMYYVAEEGDTLIKLSRAFGVPLGQLIELNGIHDADVIPAGMILLFPSDTAAAE